MMKKIWFMAMFLIVAVAVSAAEEQSAGQTAGTTAPAEAVQPASAGATLQQAVPAAGTNLPVAPAKPVSVSIAEITVNLPAPSPEPVEKQIEMMWERAMQINHASDKSRTAMFNNVINPWTTRLENNVMEKYGKCSFEITYLVPEAQLFIGAYDLIKSAIIEDKDIDDLLEEWPAEAQKILDRCKNEVSFKITAQCTEKSFAETDTVAFSLADNQDRVFTPTEITKLGKEENIKKFTYGYNEKLGRQIMEPSIFIRGEFFVRFASKEPIVTDKTTELVLEMKKGEMAKRIRWVIALDKQKQTMVEIDSARAAWIAKMNEINPMIQYANKGSYLEVAYLVDYWEQMTKDDQNKFMEDTASAWYGLKGNPEIEIHLLSSGLKSKVIIRKIKYTRQAK